MATNPFFYENRAAEDRSLVEDIIIETIQIAGINCFYIKKTFQDIDKILGEDNLMAFRDAFLMEMYIDNIDGYGGEGQLISKFGIEVRNKITFTISMKRFLEETGMERPQEGDLVWFSLTNCFFEILFVEDNSPFLEMGANFTYKLQCQTWNYSHEEISIDEGVLDHFAVQQEVDAGPQLEDNQDFLDFSNDKISGKNIFGIKIS